MVKVFRRCTYGEKVIFFLGTGGYVSCNYYLDRDGEWFKVENKCYIQEALLNILTKTGIEIDEVVIFLTEEAKSFNWENNRKYPEKSGLEKSLEEYKEKIKITPVDIPVGMSEDELWVIFDKILENIKENDEIFYDITHSFRSLPLLAIIVLNYAKFVKNCHLRGIYYGAVESLGKPSELEKIDPDKRNAPIFDLTPFVNLLDWTAGIDRFINTGDASPIVELTKQDVKAMGIKGDRENKKLFEKLAKDLENFSKIINTCRGQEISSSAINFKNRVRDVLDKKGEHYIKPIGPLLEIIDERFSSFNDNPYNNMLEGAKWCLEHNLIQQGLTILQESIISFICEKNHLELTSDKDRGLVTQAFKIKEENLPFERWENESKNNKEIIEKMLSSEIFSKNKEFCNLMRNITNLRNDMNHAGWRENPCNAKRFKQKLHDYIQKTEKILKYN